jgi:hypothetical protein
MKHFVPPGSIVRAIWGKSDTVLFIFAGAAAEFSLNKAVDWLYFTGRLPADPLGRLFSTVAYARQIIFSDEANALAAIDRIRMIHTGVETGRGTTIPDWAYRAVLYMLVHYSIASFELLERPLTRQEKGDVFGVFRQAGQRMGIPGLPAAYDDWAVAHQAQLEQDLGYSTYTADLYRQYRKHLGAVRYFILLKVQSRLLPEVPQKMLRLHPSRLLALALPLYKLSCKLGLSALLKALFVPGQYYAQVKELDVQSGKVS